MASKTDTREFSKLVARAEAAGKAAAAAANPTPMIVAQHANPLDDGSPVVQSWYVPGGVCGFAWVKLYPATSAFARYLKKAGKASTDRYAGGLHVNCPLMTQSMETKEAYCAAYAKVLREAGYNAYMHSRMD